MPQHSKPLPSVRTLNNDWSQSITQPLTLRLGESTTARAGIQPSVRLIRLDEINEEGHQAYRQALANVYATLDPAEPVRLLYLLDGGPMGVSLYFGVAADSANVDLLHEAMKNLRGALEGQLPGINFGQEIAANDRDALLRRLHSTQRRGVLLGTPTAQQQDPQGGNSEQNFQDIDRLVRAMQSGSEATDSWLLAIISQPLTRLQIDQQLNAAYVLSSQLAQYTSTSVQFGGNRSHQAGISTGSSESRGTNTGTTQTTGSNNSDTRGTSTSDTRGRSTSDTLGSNTSDTKGANTSDTTGQSRSATTGDSKSDTHGKNQGGSENKSSSQSKSSSVSTSCTSGTSSSLTQGKSSSLTKGTSESRTTGASNSRTTGTSDSATMGASNSKTTGTSTSDSRTDGKSFTHSTNESSNQSDTTGQSLNVSKEITDKRFQHLVDYVDKQLIARLQKGLTKGLFHSTVYLAADNAALYQRLKHTVRATFQGSESTLAPLQVHDLPLASTPGQLLCLPTVADMPAPEQLLFQSLHANEHHRLGSLMTADELAIVASLPQHELQGVRRRRSVEFIVDLPEVAQDPLDLGYVIDRGRRYDNNSIRLAKHDLNKHVFVTGVTGAGKTNTCLNLLLASELPFLVIEPAKTEYRELATCLGSIDYYRPNGDDHQSLRINPFALVRPAQRIKSHAGFLKNVFAAIFPMEASMPAMVEAAILAAYEDKGWDVDDNDFLPGGDPFDAASRAWPTMTDMIGQLDRLIPTYKMGKEFEEKYRGSLVSRLRSLTDGTLGQVLDVPQSLSFDALLDRRAVIELEELQSGEEKALLMALLLGGINEAIRARFVKEPSFRHLTLIEEAHRLLSRPEAGDKAGALAVEAFADMLAEVRKYGEGLIIADQIPAKLIPDVIKNTHTKIVHRLFAEDDRRAMGEAMMMDDEQRDFLPNLKVGEAIVFCGGWHGPAHAAIRNDLAQTDNNGKPALNLDNCGAQQLWRERTRYYPQFCRIGWLSAEGDAPQTFARFVRATRQAQKQLLRLIAPQTKSAHAATAFDRLKQWHAEWQPQAQVPLADAWMTLLLDANPRPHADKKDIKSLIPGEFLAQVCQMLMKVLAESGSTHEWRQYTTTVRTADLRDHFEHIAQFKSF